MKYFQEMSKIASCFCNFVQIVKVYFKKELKNSKRKLNNSMDNYI